MPVVLLHRRKSKLHRFVRPSQCPNCGSAIFQRWGEVKKPIRDKDGVNVTVYRYRCELCQKTFRDYPVGFDRSNYSLGTKQLAALIWALGYSYRDIVELFQKYEITLSRSTVWREGQALAAKLNGRKLYNYRKTYTIDQNYVHQVSSNLGVVIAVDIGDGQYAILGTLDEDNPQSVKSWLRPLIKNAEIEILQLQTGKLDLLCSSKTINTGRLIA